MLRIPTGLKVKLIELAEREHRSLNKQIEFILDRSIQENTVSDASRSSKAEGKRPKLTKP